MLNLLSVLCLCILSALGPSLVAATELVCNRKEVANLTLDAIKKPASMLDDPIYDLSSPQECYEACCLAYGAGCNVALYQILPQQQRSICVLLNCTPFYMCYWTLGQNSFVAQIRASVLVTVKNENGTLESFNDIVPISNTGSETLAPTTITPEATTSTIEDSASKNADEDEANSWPLLDAIRFLLSNPTTAQPTDESTSNSIDESSANPGDRLTGNTMADGRRKNRLKNGKKKKVNIYPTEVDRIQEDDSANKPVDSVNEVIKEETNPDWGQIQIEDSPETNEEEANEEETNEEEANEEETKEDDTQQQYSQTSSAISVEVNKTMLTEDRPSEEDDANSMDSETTDMDDEESAADRDKEVSLMTVDSEHYTPGADDSQPTENSNDHEDHENSADDTTENDEPVENEVSEDYESDEAAPDNSRPTSQHVENYQTSIDTESIFVYGLGEPVIAVGVCSLTALVCLVLLAFCRKRCSCDNEPRYSKLSKDNVRTSETEATYTLP